MTRQSPMQRHQLRAAALHASQGGAQDGQQRAIQWLHTQRGHLSALQSRQAREAHKAQVLPEIEPYLRAALEADTGQPDPIVSYAAVWALDAAAWPLALELGAYVIRHGLALPDEFQRNAPTLLVDLMADAALTGRMPAADAPAHLLAALATTQGANMPDQTRAKAHKAIAYGLAGKTTLAGQAGSWQGLSAANLAMALEHLTRAEQLDPNVGVKKDIAAVQKLIKTTAPTTDQPPAEAEAKPPAHKAGGEGRPAPRKPAAIKRKTT